MDKKKNIGMLVASLLLSLSCGNYREIMVTRNEYIYANGKFHLQTKSGEMIFKEFRKRNELVELGYGLEYPIRYVDKDKDGFPDYKYRMLLGGRPGQCLIALKEKVSEKEKRDYHRIISSPQNKIIMNIYRGL